MAGKRSRLPRKDWGKIPSGQAKQSPGSVAVYIPDATYGREDDSNWEKESRAFKAQLEAEFQLHFEATDIGPGWSIPAFITLLYEHWDNALLLWLAGKEITDGWEWWSKIFEKLRPFLKRKVRFSRDGSSVLAMRAVMDLLGHEPRSIRMIGYTPWDATGGELDLETEPPPSKIEDAAPDLWVGVTNHYFLIEADGRMFKVAVESDDVRVVED